MNIKTFTKKIFFALLIVIATKSQHIVAGLDKLCTKCFSLKTQISSMPIVTTYNTETNNLLNALHMAVSNHCQTCTKTLLEHGADPTLALPVEPQKLSAIHLAASCLAKNISPDFLNILQSLIGDNYQRANTPIADGIVKGTTPLYIFAQFGCTRGLEYLLFLPGININSAKSNGWTPLVNAIFNRKYDFIDKLLFIHPNLIRGSFNLNHDVSIPYQVWVVLCSRNFDTYKRYFSNEPQNNKIIAPIKDRMRGATPILMALNQNITDFIVQYKRHFSDSLLQNLSSNHNKPPLWVQGLNLQDQDSLRFAHNILIKAITKKKFSNAAQEFLKSTNMTIAPQAQEALGLEDWSETIKTIIEAHDNNPNIILNCPNEIEYHDLPLLHAAVKAGADSVVNLLLKHPNINLDLGGFTALHRAVDEKQYALIPPLCRFISLHAPDEEGITPFVIAAENNDLMGMLTLCAHDKSRTSISKQTRHWLAANKADNIEIMCLLKALNNDLQLPIELSPNLKQVVDAIEDFKKCFSAKATWDVLNNVYAVTRQQRDLNGNNKQIENLVQFARENNSLELRRILHTPVAIQRFTQTDIGIRALHTAIEHNSLEAIILLCSPYKDKATVNPNVLQEGLTPLARAIKNHSRGYLATVSVLQSLGASIPPYQGEDVFHPWNCATRDAKLLLKAAQAQRNPLPDLPAGPINAQSMIKELRKNLFPEITSFPEINAAREKIADKRKQLIERLEALEGSQAQQQQKPGAKRKKKKQATPQQQRHVAQQTSQQQIQGYSDNDDALDTDDDTLSTTHLQNDSAINASAIKQLDDDDDDNDNVVDFNDDEQALVQEEPAKPALTAAAAAAATATTTTAPIVPQSLSVEHSVGGSTKKFAFYSNSPKIPSWQRKAQETFPNLTPLINALFERFNKNRNRLDFYHQLPLALLRDKNFLGNALVLDKNTVLDFCRIYDFKDFLEGNEFALVLPSQILPVLFEQARALFQDTRRVDARVHQGAFVAILKLCMSGFYFCKHLCFHEEIVYKQEREEQKLTEQRFMLN